MVISNIIGTVIQYLAEGFARIFSPTDDAYPAVGVQPFGGDVYVSHGYFDIQ